MQISDTGLNLIKQFEGLRLEAYYCPAGKLTVGYGHLVPGWKVGTLITEAEADDFLRMDVQGTEKAVNRLISVTLTQCMFDALCSFTFNVGTGALETSTLRKHLNCGCYERAAEEFLRWVYVKGRISNGLKKRRLAEKALFLRGYK